MGIEQEADCYRKAASRTIDMGKAKVSFQNSCTVAEQSQGTYMSDNGHFFIDEKSKKSYNFFGISAREALENERKE